MGGGVVGVSWSLELALTGTARVWFSLRGGIKDEKKNPLMMIVLKSFNIEKKIIPLYFFVIFSFLAKPEFG